jgi:hypothetical protein
VQQAFTLQLRAFSLFKKVHWSKGASKSESALHHRFVDLIMLAKYILKCRRRISIPFQTGQEEA